MEEQIRQIVREIFSEALLKPVLLENEHFSAEKIVTEDELLENPEDSMLEDMMSEDDNFAAASYGGGYVNDEHVGVDAAKKKMAEQKSPSDAKA